MSERGRGMRIGLLLSRQPKLRPRPSITTASNENHRRMNEELKQPLLIGAICGATTVMLYQFAFNWSGAVMGFVIAVVLGLVVGGIGFGIAYAVMRNR